MAKFALITEVRYLNPDRTKVYNQNILEEDRLLKAALQERGIESERVAWDDPGVDWSQYEVGIFRTTWNYFNRFPAFRYWLDTTRKQLLLVNKPTLIDWNLDKHYLLDLDRAGVPVVPSLVMEANSWVRLEEMTLQMPANEWILKPCISGAARHTYRFTKDQTAGIGSILTELLQTEAMLLQPFVETVLEQGEVSLMYFGGIYSHAVLKKAKAGDFRVQDDFGGTLHDWEAGSLEKKVAEAALAACPNLPVYARVDLLFQPGGQPMVSELELIEPEIWLRRKPEAAKEFVNSLLSFLEVMA